MGRQEGSCDHNRMPLVQRSWARLMNLILLSYLDRSRAVTSGEGHLSRLLACHGQGIGQLKQGDTGEAPDLSKTHRNIAADSSSARNFWYVPRKF